MRDTGEYMCLKCGQRTHFGAGVISCTNCGASKLTDLVPVYMEDDLEEEQFLGKDDFGQGD